MRQWVERLLLVVISTILVLLILEGVVRLVRPRIMVISTAKMHRSDPDAGWVGLPNIDARFFLPGGFDVRVANNSRGLRDSEKDLAKPPGTRRIVVLGDSFMWGFGVDNEDTFSTILQELIPDTQTINLGVSGYSTVQELVRLQMEGVRYMPDVILLAFVWNDLRDNFDGREGTRPVAEIAEDGVLRIANRPVRKALSSPITQWFRHNSWLFGFIEYRLRILKDKRELHRRANTLRTGPQSSDDASHTAHDGKGAMDFSVVDIYGPPRPEMDLAWNAVRLLLSRMKDLAMEDGARLIVFYVPKKEDADKEIFDISIGYAGLDSESPDIDWDRPSKRLGDVCAALDVPCVNLTPIFRGHPEPFSLFLKNDPHWSPEGHRLAAETVAARLVDLQIESVEERERHPEMAE